MKILYLSCHSVLEYDEVSLLTEMGHDVFSMGAYSNPTLSGDGKRPSIKGAKFYPELYSTSLQCSKENIHPELVNWADIVIMMHNAKIRNQPEEQPWLVGSWPLFKGKRTIWRSIGQSLPRVEKELAFYKDQGLQIVRYSPKEREIPGYAGEDALIRFYKDPDEYKDWNGKTGRVINFTQSIKRRGTHCGYQVFMDSTKKFPRKVFGSGNQDLRKLWGGILSPDELKKALQDSRVYFYFGTVPASYTLSLIEAMMTGTPVVAAGPGFSRKIYDLDTNEITEIIQNGVNGFVSDNVGDLRDYIKLLLKSKPDATRISIEARKTAISLFGKKKIMEEWERFLNKK